MIDIRNHGNSEIVSDYFYLGQKEYLDVLGAYDWLMVEKNYNPSSIGIVSISTYSLATTLAFDESGIVMNVIVLKVKALIHVLNTHTVPVVRD